MVLKKYLKKIYQKSYDEYGNLNKLDTSNLGEVQNFKRKYAQTLGQYGQDFFR